MGNFYSAARDTIFYAHHCNIDRLWTIWQGLGRKRRDYTDPDWLNSEFLFYDEDAQLVRIKVRDCVDEKKLRYQYQEVDIPWLKTPPKPRKIKAKLTAAGSGRGGQFPRTLDSVVKTVVQRPKKSRSKKEKEDEEEVLVIYGIEFDKETFVKFDVFVNEEDETLSGPSKREFAGSFASLPHKHGKKMKKLKTRLRLGLTDILEDLGADDDESIVVALVPREGKDVSIGGLKIEYLAS